MDTPRSRSAAPARPRSQREGQREAAETDGKHGDRRALQGALEQ